MMYRVIKVLNNNGILARNDETGKETILMGKGLGFGKQPGQRLEGISEAKRYELVSGRYSALQQVNSIDPAYIEMTARIIDEAEKSLGPLRHDILIPMADHIALAVNRAREGCELPNPFKHDIQALFNREYQAALAGQAMIEETVGVEISADEVGYITLHIHAGLSDEKVSEALETARLVKEAVSQIGELSGLAPAADSLGYNRLVSHVRYMIARTRKGERANLDMEDYARANFPEVYAVAEEVCRNMSKQLRLPVAKEEVGFLAIHIQRIAGR